MRPSVSGVGTSTPCRCGGASRAGEPSSPASGRPETVGAGASSRTRRTHERKPIGAPYRPCRTVPGAYTVVPVLIAAALVPDTALLVPGASGRSELLAAERSAALEAVRRVVAAGPGRLVVVAAPAPRGPGLRTTGPVRPTLAAAGL